MELVKKIATNDVVVRSTKTFVQAFLATIVAGVVAVDSVEATKALFVAALAAGISAVWNGLKEKIK